TYCWENTPPVTPTQAAAREYGATTPPISPRCWRCVPSRPHCTATPRSTSTRCRSDPRCVLQVACRRMRVAQPVESSRCGSRDSRIRIRHATAVLAAQRHRPRGSVAPTRDDAADAADETDPDGASGGFCAGSYRSSSARTEYGSAHRDEYVVITGL